jgi:hypothetical protein
MLLGHLNELGGSGVLARHETKCSVAVIPSVVEG